LDFDLGIAMAQLAAHRMFESVRLGGRDQPLFGFFVGRDQDRALAVLRGQITEQGRGRERDRGMGGDGFMQGGDPVQMRIDRHHGIEQIGQKGTDDALAHGFAGMKRDVLAHVGQIGRDQGQIPCAELACGARGQQQFDELVVGPIERAQDDDPAGQMRRQAQLGLAVGKTMAFDEMQFGVAGRGQPFGGGAFVFECEQGRCV
jgi:hypothetical protein